MKKQLTLLAGILFVSILTFTGCSNTEVAEVTDTKTNAAEEKNTESNTSEVDTSNWSTYQNDEYGFFLYYPDEHVEIASGVENFHYERDYNYSLSFATKDKDETLGEGHSIFFLGYSTESFDELSTELENNGAQKEIQNIAGIQFHEYTFYTGIDDTGNTNTRVFIGQHNDDYIIIEQSYFGVNTDYDQWFDGILHSITFS